MMERQEEETRRARTLVETARAAGAAPTAELALPEEQPLPEEGEGWEDLLPNPNWEEEFEQVVMSDPVRQPA